MPRIDDWPEALHLFVEEKRTQPFVWGQNDCCLFACDWLSILLRKDYSRGFRGRYKTAKGGVAMLRRKGGVEAIVDKHFTRHTGILYARRGDLVTVPAEGYVAVGVCIGSKVAAVSASGLLFLDLTKSLTAWRTE